MEKIVYYTDGSCSGNPGPGGFAYIRLSKEYRQTYMEYIESLSVAESYAEYCDETTNNREELKAIIKVLELIEPTKQQYEYVIYSDSAYAVNICNDWMWKWKENGWRKNKTSTVKNLDLVTKLYNLLIHNTEVQIKKCDGHSGILENELCDALASKNETKFNRLIKEHHILL